MKIEEWDFSGNNDGSLNEASTLMSTIH